MSHTIAGITMPDSKPDSTFGTVNDDVLAFKDSRLQRTDLWKVILASAWAS